MKTKQKRALITGITGQDGSYLAELLLKKGYRISGLVRKTSQYTPANIEHIKSDLDLFYGDLLDSVSMSKVLSAVDPDEIYNLAAQSSPGESFKQPIYTAEITGIGAHRLFDVVRDVCPKARVYQASTSEMYGWVKEIPQNEETPFNPANPYAASKLYAHNIAHIYRKSYGLFISCGILFNHESPRRGMEFVTQKITYAAACAKLGIKNSRHLNEEGESIFENNTVHVGNLDAKRDWGYAPDYVEAMWKMLQLKKPDDFVLATGENHTVADLCEAAFKHVSLDWKKFVVVDPRFVRPTETGPLVGNPKKAKRVLGWKPKVTFEKLIEIMVDANLEKLK